AHIIGIELLAAAQGIDFLRPLKSSAPIEAAHALLREHCSTLTADRTLAPDIERATNLVRDDSLVRAAYRCIERTAPPRILSGTIKQASAIAHD
ncbi:MAG: hypothetical protein ACRECQ_04155, partial [Burkholderiaceae bacterium]